VVGLLLRRACLVVVESSGSGQAGDSDRDTQQNTAPHSPARSTGCTAQDAQHRMHSTGCTAQDAQHRMHSTQHAPVRPGLSRHVPARLYDARHAKVGDLDAAVVVQQQVGRLEVSGGGWLNDWGCWGGRGWLAGVGGGWFAWVCVVTSRAKAGGGVLLL